MIEVKEYTSGNPITLVVDDIVAIKAQESLKRCYVYTRNQWFFDVRAEYRALKAILKKRHLPESKTEDETDD